MNEHEQFAQWIEQLPPEAKQKFTESMTKVFSYEPKVAIFGKTGVGKSSLTNALFGQDVCKISDVEACTRDPQEVFMKLEGASKGIKLLDVPGIGESSERDKEYFKLYAEILKEADMAMKGRHFDEAAGTPDPILKRFLEEQAVSIQQRIQESLGIHIPKPVMYSAAHNFNIHAIIDDIIQVKIRSYLVAIIDMIKIIDTATGGALSAIGGAILSLFG